MQIHFHINIDDRLLKKLKTLSQRRWLVLSLTVLIVLSTLLLYGTLHKPYTFQPGEVIHAAEINANFDLLFRKINTHDPPGSIIAFGGTTAPEGWLFCDGHSVNSADYPDLFAAIGTSWGGDGSPNFNLPDLRGEFIRGWDYGRGVDQGRTFGSNQSDDYKRHAHDLGASVSPNGHSGGEFVDYYNSLMHWGYGATAGWTSNSGGIETRPRNVALNFIIKY